MAGEDAEGRSRWVSNCFSLEPGKKGGKETSSRGKCPELNAHTRLPDWEELAIPTGVFPPTLERRSRYLV